MKESNYNVFIAMRLLVSLLPLALGWPMLAFCFCVHNLIMITVARGPVYGGVTVAGTAVAGALLCYGCGFGAAYGGFFALQLALASTLCSIVVITRRGFSLGLLAASLSYGLGDILNMKQLAEKAGLSIADYMFSGVQSVLEQSMSAYEQQLSAAGASVNTNGLLAMASDGIKSCVPAVIIFSALLAGYILMWMVSRTLRGTSLDNRHSFAEIRLSVPAVCFGAIMLGLLFVPSNSVNLVGLNGLLVFLTLAFAAGLSLVEYLLRLKIKGAFARIAIHVLIFTFSIAASSMVFFANIFLIYALLGIVDCFASIRKRVTAAS